MNARFTLALALIGLSTSLAFAGGPGPAAAIAAEHKADASQKREAQVDKREARQAKRIEEGIKKGALTTTELASLENRETDIANLEKDFEGDGKLTKPEAKQLRQALDDASIQIWAEKHDTDGTQLPVQRLGKDIFADPTLTDRIESGSMTRPEARAFLEELREMVHIKKCLASDDLTAAERAKLQARYNDLLNKYFQQK